MFLICKSESTKSSCCLLDLEPLRHSIAECTMVKDTLALIQERVYLIVIIIIIIIIIITITIIIIIIKPW